MSEETHSPGDAEASESPADLRRSIVQVAKRTAALESERNALEEVCDDLQMRENGLSQRLADAQEENSVLKDRVQASLTRSKEFETQIEINRLAIAGLERKLATSARRTETLTRELDVLTQELGEHQGQVSNTDLSLKTIHESVASMDQKLSFVRRKGSSLLLEESEGTSEDMPILGDAVADAG